MKEGNLLVNPLKLQRQAFQLPPENYNQLRNCKDLDANMFVKIHFLYLHLEMKIVKYFVKISDKLNPGARQERNTEECRIKIYSLNK